MSIKAACPSCDRVHTLADDLLGKKIRCKSCDVAFRVEETGAAEALPAADFGGADALDLPRKRSAPAVGRRPRDDEEDRPRRSRDRDDEDDYDRPARRRPKQSSGSSVILIVGLVIGGVLLLVVVVGVVIGVMVRSAAESVVHDIADHQNFPVNNDDFRMPGMPPANADWNQLQKGMTFEQVVAIFGEPSQDHTFQGAEVVHAGLTQQEVTGPDGRQKPVRKLLYFKGQWQPGFVDVILVDGRVYKVNK